MPLTEIHSARVIAITQPVDEVIEELGVNDAEGLTAYITRVSNPNNQSSNKVAGLIKYCCKHGHWSILEHVYMTMEILTTRDISAQICRHRSFTFQEFSQRYSTTDNFSEPYEVPHLRLQDTHNRQKSIVTSEDWILRDEPIIVTVGHMRARCAEALRGIYDLYQVLLSSGVAKECARRILPLSSTTKIYMTGNIRSWLFYIKARNTTDGKAQVEHNWVADACEEYFAKYFPVVYGATFNNEEI